MLPDNPVAWAVKAFHDGRNDTYRRYQAYLDGDQPLMFATEKFRSAFGRLFEAFAYNRCEAVVDAHADRLQVGGFGANNETVSGRAQEVWDANHMDVREGHIESDAFGLGDSHLIVEKHVTSGDVHMWIQNPATVRVHYSEDVPGQIDLAAKTWRDEREYQRLNLYFAGRIEKYISRHRAFSGMPTSDKSFQRYDFLGEPWSFVLNVPDVVPVFPFANNGRTNSYGVSELRHVLPLQDALNKTIMDTLVAMEFAAYPQRVIIGVEPTEDQEKVIQRFEAGLTRIVTLFAPDAKIGEFSAANIAQYLAIAEFFDLAIARVTKVPVHHLTMTGGFPSGRALRIAEAPFTRKLEDRQKAFSVPFSEAMSYGLALDGLATRPGDLRINWTPAAPLSEEDELDMALQKDSLGFPLEQILKEMGYEESQITDILEAKRKVADEGARMFNRGVVVPPVSDEEAA